MTSYQFGVLVFLLGGLIYLLWSLLVAINNNLNTIRERLWDFGVRERELDKPSPNRDVPQVLDFMREELIEIKESLRNIGR